MPRSPRRPIAPVIAFVAVTAAACGGGEQSSVPSTAAATAASTTTSSASTTTSSASTTTSSVAATTTAPPEPFTILITNDDGVAAPGIDALVESLGDIPGATLVVYAPATNQSGSSDTTSAVLPGVSEAATASGFPAIAVEGTPADSVLVALQRDGLRPDVVVSGVNTGQNIGTFVPLSGTVGAARTAARLGIPAVAISAGDLENPDYRSAAEIARVEVISIRPTLGFGRNTDATVVNLNAPSCPAGQSVRGVVDVPVATVFPPGTNGLDLTFDCESSANDATDDATALVIGFASRSIVPADL